MYISDNLIAPLVGMRMLRIEGLEVTVSGRLIIKNASLHVREGDVVYLLGPNASGKTTLLRAIMGFPNYHVTKGRILFKGVDITGYAMEARVRMGLGMTYQIPPKIEGLKVSELIKELLKRRKVELDYYEEIVSTLNIEHLLNRDLNKNFSGGEMKRVEVALLMAQLPQLALVDEPDSGVDVESVMYIAEGLKKLLRDGACKSMVIVTHTAFIAKYLRPTHVCVMKEGEIRECGGLELMNKVMKEGFKTW